MGSLIVVDARFGIIRARAVTIKVLNILDNNAE
jgi:hypothetical protein